MTHNIQFLGGLTVGSDGLDDETRYSLKMQGVARSPGSDSIVPGYILDQVKSTRLIQVTDKLGMWNRPLVLRVNNLEDLLLKLRVTYSLPNDTSDGIYTEDLQEIKDLDECVIGNIYKYTISPEPLHDIFGTM